MSIYKVVVTECGTLAPSAGWPIERILLEYRLKTSLIYIAKKKKECNKAFSTFPLGHGFWISFPFIYLFCVCVLGEGISPNPSY